MGVLSLLMRAVKRASMIIVGAIVIFELLLITVSTAHAEDVSSILEAPIHGYLVLAFSTKHLSLEKFDGDGTYSASFDCETLDAGICHDDLNTLLTSTHKFFINFPKGGGPLHFIFGHSDALAKRIANVADEYKQGYSDTSVPTCQVFVMTDGFAIKEATVIVADDQSILRQQICFARLTARALGLKPWGDQKFSDRWEAGPDSLSTVTDQGMPGVIETGAQWLYIHGCKQLKPGMNPDQVTEILSDLNGCLKPWVTAKGK